MNSTENTENFPIIPTADLPSHLRPINLRRDLAAEYLQTVHGLRCAKSTLATYVTIGGGPTYKKPNTKRGTPTYPRIELDRWAAKKLGTLRKSSSDTGTGA